jgi:hypothetical protein
MAVVLEACGCQAGLAAWGAACLAPRDRRQATGDRRQARREGSTGRLAAVDRADAPTAAQTRIEPSCSKAQSTPGLHGVWHLQHARGVVPAAGMGSTGVARWARAGAQRGARARGAHVQGVCREAVAAWAGGAGGGGYSFAAIPLAGGGGYSFAAIPLAGGGGYSFACTQCKEDRLSLSLPQAGQEEVAGLQGKLARVQAEYEMKDAMRTQIMQETIKVPSMARTGRCLRHGPHHLQ